MDLRVDRKSEGSELVTRWSATQRVLAHQKAQARICNRAHEVARRRLADEKESALRATEERLRLLDELNEATRLVTEPDQLLPLMLRLLGERLNVSRCHYADMSEDGEGFNIPYEYLDGGLSTVGSHRLSDFGARVASSVRKAQSVVVRDLKVELAGDDGVVAFGALNIEDARHS